MNQPSSYPWRNSLLLLLTATIWGIAFVAQSIGMDYVGPFTFNAIRFFLGALVLLPVIKIRESMSPSPLLSCPRQRSVLIQGGFICGLCLCAASNFQQFGIKYTTVGKAGFITACYIIIVPVLGLFLKKNCGFQIWAAVVLALAGLYLLCLTDGFLPGKGDLLVFICAFLFSGHILVIDYYSPQVDGVKMSCIQFFTAAVISLIPALILEHPSLKSLQSAWLPIGYAGFFSCGIAYTLQIIGQRGMNPTIASLILSLESSISVMAGWLILKQAMSVRELSGCILMFAAIILAQLPSRKEALSRAVPEETDFVFEGLTAEAEKSSSEDIKAAHKTALWEEG
ncbi:MAG: DMT family transporter [Blautia sp.]|nr:DMT family transporter [Blautia sp.]